MPTVASATLAASSPTTPTTLVEWLGLRFDVPSHWEIIRHSTSPRKGSLVFADRTRQRLQVTWTACTKRPDVARLLADHRAQQRERDPDALITTPLLPAGWRGMQRPQNDGELLTRAARFDAPSSRLIEIVYDGDPALLDDLLIGLRVTGPANAARRVCAFHLDLTVPEGFELVGTRIQPADAALTLSTRRDAKEPGKLPSLTVRRRAMADVWFDGNLRRLLRAHAPRAKMSFSEASVSDLLPSLEGGAGVGCGGTISFGNLPQLEHPPLTPPSREGGKKLAAESPATLATWNVPGPRFRRLLNLHHVARAAAWHCPAERAVYDVVMTGPAKSPPTFDGLRLICGQGGCGA